METTAPQASPPPSGVRFISIEDFDANFPAPEIGQPYVQNPPLVQSSTADSSVAVNEKAGSESGGSTTSTPDLGTTNWIGKLQGTVLKAFMPLPINRKLILTLL